MIRKMSGGLLPGLTVVEKRRKTCGTTLLTGFARG